MKKRVLLVTNGFPFGESERSFLSEEVKLLAEQFDLLVLAPQNDDALLYPVEGIVRIERYRFTSFRQSRELRSLPHVFCLSALEEACLRAKRNGFATFAQDLKETLYFRFNVWEMEQKIAQLVQEEKIDLVYTYWCTECTAAAVNLKKRFPKLRVITRFHGVDLYQERTDSDWQPFRHRIARLADGLCFACSYGRSYFLAHWGEEFDRKAKLFYLGCTDRGLIGEKPDQTLRIVSCSNLIPLKRVDRIIEGLALLPETAQVQWHLFGDGPERQKLETLADEKLAGRGNVFYQFHGFVPNGELTEKYREIAPHLFLTTSSTEGGAPVSVQEAFSMGIPAIGTEVGGIPDLIQDGKTGYLLPETAEPSAVASAIERYCSLTAAEKENLRSAARQRWADCFDATKNAAQFTAYLQELLRS